MREPWAYIHIVSSRTRADDNHDENVFGLLTPAEEMMRSNPVAVVEIQAVCAHSLNLNARIEVQLVVLQSAGLRHQPVEQLLTEAATAPQRRGGHKIINVQEPVLHEVSVHPKTGNGRFDVERHHICVGCEGIHQIDLKRSDEQIALRSLNRVDSHGHGPASANAGRNTLSAGESGWGPPGRDLFDHVPILVR